MTARMYDVIVIGGGAAGLFVSSLLGEKQKKVLLIEHNKEFGRKILISGGGRCNFTNLNVEPEDFYCTNKHFHKSALSRFSPQDFLKLVESHGISWFEKKDGQLFCEGSAREIVQLLISECNKGNVDLYKNCEVENISFEDSYDIFTNKGLFKAKKLVIATGGLSLAQIGATDFGHRVALQFGHELVDPFPALVPLIMEPVLSNLAGLSLPVRISIDKNVIEDDLLFTHKGISGPAVLRISLYWSLGAKVKIDFTGGKGLEERLRIHKKKSLLSALNNIFPKRFSEVILESVTLDPKKKLEETSRKDLNRLSDFVTNFTFIPNRTGGYRKAEVTRGGVSVSKISSKTMESELQPGLFFIGEVLDVTGQLGGYNFQWAWSSAFSCADAIN